MKNIIIWGVFLLMHISQYAQKLYVKTFGDRTGKAIIFLHGGPGYNSAGFEATTAQALADNGFFVITYDRRGEGRSPDPSAAYTFVQTFDDLKNIYQIYSLSKACLIGHSFGGIVGTLFARLYPDKIQSLILVSAPVSLQRTFRNIIRRSKNIYTAQNDTSNLYYMKLLEKMDTTTLEYSSYCFAHAIQNGFYLPSHPSAEAKDLYTRLRKDSLFKYTSLMDYQAPQGFFKNERYTTINLAPVLQQLLEHHTQVYGLYGKDDGLYAPTDIYNLINMLGANNVLYLDNCSHNVFIDQQFIFISTLKSWD